MASFLEVVGAIQDFRTELFQLRSSSAANLRAATAKIGLRGLLGVNVSPLQNIHATGIGIRRKAGRLFPLEFVIKLFVFHKVRDITPKLIPPLLRNSFQGVDIDVEELPVLEIQPSTPRKPVHSTRSPQREIVAGMEIQPLGASFTGTLGGFVRSVTGSPETIFALSNNHVLANTNKLPTGTEIVQPSSNGPSDIFARLSNVETIHFPSLANPYPPMNRIDAAIARVTDATFVTTKKIHGISKYTPSILSAKPGMKVMKSGKTTGVTHGTVTAIDVSGVKVNYGTPSAPQLAAFDHVLNIESPGGPPFSQKGDSGSMILDSNTGCPVGLLFGGDQTVTVASDMHQICNRFNVIPV